MNTMLEEKIGEVLVLTVTTAKMRVGFQASDPESLIWTRLTTSKLRLTN